MKNIGIFILILSLSISYGQNNATEKSAIDSLKIIIKDTRHDTTVINAYRAWDNLIYLSNQELDLEINLIIIQIAEKNLLRKKISKKEEYFYNKNLSSAYNVSGLIFETIGNRERALNYYTKSITIRHKIQDLQGVSSTLINIGNIYTNVGDKAAGLKNYSQSLKIAEKINDTNLIALSYLNMATVYSDYENSKSLYFGKKAINLYESIGDNYKLGLALMNLGVFYAKLKDNDSALFYLNKSLEIKEKTGDSLGIGSSLIRLGNIYQDINDIEKAKSYYLKSLT